MWKAWGGIGNEGRERARNIGARMAFPPCALALGASASLLGGSLSFLGALPSCATAGTAPRHPRLDLWRRTPRPGAARGSAARRVVSAPPPILRRAASITNRCARVRYPSRPAVAALGVGSSRGRATSRVPDALPGRGMCVLRSSPRAYAERMLRRLRTESAEGMPGLRVDADTPKAGRARWAAAPCSNVPRPLFLSVAMLLRKRGKGR